MTEDAPVAMITGAARGIGAATARALAADGWRLVLVDRCEDDPGLPYPLATRADLDGVADACGGRARVLAVVADVRDQDALDDAVRRGIAAFGGIDAALAVAGCVAGGTPAWSTEDDVWRLVLDVNLTGVWRLARATVPALLQQPSPRRGRFIAVSSVAGTLGMPRLSAYAVAKHGVIGLVRSMAAELGPEGITVNAVAPGSTATDMLRASADVYALESVSEFAEHHQLPRLIEASEVAALIAWVCRRESAAVTGAVLAVDAGMTAS